MKKDKVGLGDVIEKITEKTGIKNFVQKFVTNGPCDGCARKKDGFNHVTLWKRSSKK